MTNWFWRIKFPFIIAEKPCNTPVLLHFSSSLKENFINDKTALHLKSSSFLEKICSIRRRYTGVFQAPGADFNKKMPIIRHFVPIEYHSYRIGLKRLIIGNFGSYKGGIPKVFSLATDLSVRCIWDKS